MMLLSIAHISLQCIQTVQVRDLPYGTHILKLFSKSDSHQTTVVTIDGIEVHSATGTIDYAGWAEATFHQPKMPPIPEDAVVLADYMLMADYVKSTAGAGEKISKGIRQISTTRDCFHDTSSGSFTTMAVDPDYAPYGFIGLYVETNPSAGSIKCKLPAFGTQFEVQTFDDKSDPYVDDSAVAHTPVAGSTSYNHLTTQNTASTLGQHTFESRNNAANNHNIQSMGIITPIHTSSHYQTFETPFLHELVGGDRNMEQTNLVVTPDGKTWDEVTRDVSYITNHSGYVATVDGVSGGFSNTTIKPDVFRGHGGNYEYFDSWTKDFAIAYDKFICLKGGMYRISYTLFSNGNNGAVLAYLQLNGSTVGNVNRVAAASSVASGANITWRSMAFMEATIYLKRGDFICATADSGGTIHGGTDGMNKFQAERVG